MKNKIQRTWLFIPLIALLLTVFAGAAEPDYSGSIEIINRKEEDGSLSFTAELSDVSLGGRLATAVFSEDGVFKNCAFYQARASVEVKLDTNSTDTVKIAWLDNSHRFLSPPVTLRMEQSDETVNVEFTAQLHELISGFNPAGGAEAADEDDPYYLQRLIVKCDTLPDLTGRTPSNILTGPAGLYILSFSTPGGARDCAAYLRTQASVRYAEPDRMLNMAVEEEPENSAQLQASGSYHSWGIEATGIGAYAENLQHRGLTNSVTVAVLDTGVDADHPFLSGRLLPAINRSTESDTRDNHEKGHGTHVAGIIADCTLGFDVKILPIKVMNQFGDFTTLTLIDGIYEAVSQGANVINLSLSAPATEEFQAIEDAVRYALSKNITVVAAAGNQNTDTSMRTPACMEECITVSAIQQNETRYGLSNHGDAVDLTAPGALINSSVPGGLFKDLSGTSMAAPHVSAAAALLIYERGTSLTPTQISKTLCSAARYLKNQTGWRSDFGAGMLDMTSFIPKVSIFFQPNGGSGLMSSQTVNAGKTTALKGNTFTWNGYDFTGWNTEADGTGTPYENLASVTITENLTLYAQWKRTAGAYAILYSNGELVFQTNSAPETGRTVTETYPIYTGTGGSAEYAAWYDQRANIKQVTFAEKIQPVSTALWFFECENLTTFSGLDRLDTSKTTDMSQMFAECTALTELDLTTFDTGSVMNMERMFFGCTALEMVFVSDTFTTGAVTSSRDMFKYCAVLEGGRGTKYDSTHTDKTYARIDGGTAAPGYFTDPNAEPGLEQIYAVLYDDGELVFQNNNRTQSGRSVTEVYEVADHYSGSPNDFAPWHEKREGITTATIADRIRPTSTAYWFLGLSSLTKFENSENLDTGNVTNMSYMFDGCSSLTNVDVSGFDTSNVTSMYCMFSGCNRLTALDVSGFDTFNVKNMSSMFSECKMLTSLNISNFDTSHVTDMSYMFLFCENLTSLDIRSFDTSNVTDMYAMFHSCYSLKTIYASSQFVTSNLTEDGGDLMFGSCDRLIGGAGTTHKYDSSEYARIDGGTSAPGYFMDPDVNVNGDIDGNGLVSQGDVDMLSNFLANLITLNDDQKYAADVDFNGTIDGADLLRLVRYVEGLDPLPTR